MKKCRIPCLLLLLLLVIPLTLCSCRKSVSESELAGVSGSSLIFNENGMYYINSFVARNGLSYYSYQGDEWKTLCPDPLCTHENQSGCFMYGKRFVRGVLEDNILYFSAWDIVSGDCILGSCDLKSMQLAEYVSYDRDTMLEEFVKYGDALYYYIINADGGYDIRRFDLSEKKDTLLYQYDQYICSMQVDHGYLALGTWEGILISDLSFQNVRLAVRFNASMNNFYYYYLHDGYLYYPTNRQWPELWEQDGGRHDGQLMHCDFYRCSADSDETTGECVLQNVYGPLYFYDQKIYYFPADLYTMLRYYFHSTQSGDADLPENLFSITGNHGGIACCDPNTGRSEAFETADTMNFSQICYMDADRMIVLGLDLRSVTIGEDRFIEGGYRSYNENRGYYLIDRTNGSCRMLVQPVPNSGY